MKTALLFSIALTFGGAGMAYAKCTEIADTDDFGPSTKYHYCDDAPSGIDLNLDTMRAAPASMTAYMAKPPAAEIRLGDETIEALASSSWGQDRATNQGKILQIADPEDALKIAQAINAGESFNIVLTDADGTEFVVFSGSFAMKIPEDRL